MTDIDQERAAIVDSLLDERTVDIITTGRTSGLLRTTEIWTTVIDGQAYICGTPNASRPGIVHQPRDWLANLVATPGFTLRLKQSVAVDLPARAERVTDRARRRSILTSPQCEYYVSQAADLETAITYCPIVAVTFTGDASWLHDALAGRSTTLDG